MVFSMRASRLGLRSWFFTVLFTFLATVPALSGESTALSPSAREWSKLLHQAQRGNPRAQTLVGIAFATGNGVKQDYSQAREWFLTAAKQADPIAEHNLAVMYLTGAGVERNPVEAAKWFEKAGATGFAQAQFNAARLYEIGAGVPKNLGKGMEKDPLPAGAFRT